MMMLNSSAGSFGPFRSAFLDGDAWMCDGIRYPVKVVGDATLSENIVPPLQPFAVPDQVTMLSARTAMYNAGWLQPWEALLTAMPGPEGDLARIKWGSALTVRRDDPLVVLGIAALGKTEAEADALFIAAAALDA